MHPSPTYSPWPRGRVLSPSELAAQQVSHPLEPSLIQLINDHHDASLSLREQTEKAKRKASENALQVSDLLAKAVDGGTQEAFVNEKRIELEIRELAATITRFAKQTDRWLASSRSIDTAVKEIGDFENWMKIMEFDCKSITSAISNIHNAQIR